MSGLSFFCIFPFLLMCGILFAKMLSSCVPSGGKILNQDCCSPCVFHLCWGCVTRILGVGGGGFSREIFIFYSHQKKLRYKDFILWFLGKAKCYFHHMLMI
jgi:hypothetical protein